MAIKNAYLRELLARVEKRNQGEPEFIQAVTEVLMTLTRYFPFADILFPRENESKAPDIRLSQMLSVFPVQRVILSAQVPVSPSLL